MREPRLGDDIDDFCVRCKRVMNHVIVSVMNGEAAKVRCRTCHNDHDFRHEQAPPPKVDPRKAALFHEVLKKVSPGDAADGEVLAEPEPAAELEVDDPVADAETDGDAPAVEEAPPKVKSKAKARGRK